MGLVDIIHPESYGYARFLDYETIHRVVDVGPVRASYRVLSTVGDTLDEGLGESTAVLTVSTNLPSD